MVSFRLVDCGQFWQPWTAWLNQSCICPPPPPHLPQDQASLGTVGEDATKLCRDTAFITFALTAALRRLQACESSELTSAIATGTGGRRLGAHGGKKGEGGSCWGHGCAGVRRSRLP